MRSYFIMAAAVGNKLVPGCRSVWGVSVQRRLYGTSQTHTLPMHGSSATAWALVYQRASQGRLNFLNILPVHLPHVSTPPLAFSRSRSFLRTANTSPSHSAAD
ncbi:hypothetical protein NL108_018703 [Boleophthalmus pectinirostris]|nr:hypothetical protein NL108_018703 [Boleophthalmus pectinirostris]